VILLTHFERSLSLSSEGAQKRKKAPTVGKGKGQKGKTKGKGQKVQPESEEEEMEDILSDTSEDGRPSKGKRMKLTAGSSEEDNFSYSGGSASPPPPRVDRPPKRRSADKPSVYSLSHVDNVLGDSDAEDDLSEPVSSKGKSKKAAVAKPRESHTNPRPKSCSAADRNVSKGKAPAKQAGTKSKDTHPLSRPTTGTGSGAGPSHKRKRDDEDSETERKERKRVTEARKQARYTALQPIAREGLAATFFVWLRDEMEASPNVDEMEWDHYIVLFRNGGSTVEAVEEFDHTLTPNQRLFKQKLTDGFFPWLYDFVCLAYPSDPYEAHQLIDAYQLTAA
jgi:hypothetical protein